MLFGDTYCRSTPSLWATNHSCSAPPVDVLLQSSDLALSDVVCSSWTMSKCSEILFWNSEEVKLKPTISHFHVLVSFVPDIFKECPDSPWTFWQRPRRLCGFAPRSRWWWGRPRRSSPGKWWSSLRPCRTSWRRRPFPSDPAWSPPPWCCRQNQGRRRIQHRLPQYSATFLLLVNTLRGDTICGLWAAQQSQYAADFTLRAPHSSTVSLSGTTVMRKLGVWSSSLKIWPFASFFAPGLKKKNTKQS